ncbi:MFS transporter [Egicoccus sp. AB-alg6-2]|uniref:MFS transporter n=1 Tax=Egicoccus sp. AB-alg6-2 TaxID=3242692 RepID=UPI00359E3C20
MSAPAPSRAPAVPLLRTTATASAALTAAVLPVFLLGALSDHLRRDLGIDETGVGAAVTLLFLTAAVTAPLAGRFAERFGAAVALRSGVLLAGVLAAVTGTLAQRWWQLALPLAFVGVAVGLVDTGAARAFVDRIVAERHGSAFGIKEASVPAASLLAGLSVPTVAAFVGWRAAFVATLGVAVVVAVCLPRDRSLSARSAGLADAPTPVGDPSGGVVPAAMLLFAVAAGLGAGAATAAATFLVPALADRGFGVAAAGLTLSVASVASIAARLTLGRWADRPSASPTLAVSLLCLLGGGAAVALALPSPAIVGGVAAVVLLGAGWGWTGLAFLAAVRAHPAAPAAAAGIVLSGLGGGGALGPLVFGALAGRVGYATAWTAVAIAFLAAAAASGVARRRLPAAMSASRASRIPPMM